MERPDAGDALSGRLYRRIANVNGNVPRALIPLAGANANRTVAADLDVGVVHGDVDAAVAVMHEGHGAGIRAVCHDGSAAHVNVNVAGALLNAPDAVEISFAVDLDVDVLGIDGQVAYALSSSQ